MTTNKQTLFADGFDDAIIGYSYDKKVCMYRIVYDKERMIETLMIRDDMSLDVSSEYLEFNTWDAYVGDGSPLYVDVMGSVERPFSRNHTNRKDIEEYLLL